jgi:hypothetical protein
MTRTVPAFDELQLRLTPGRDAGYHVAISSAAGARANGTFTLPFSGLELENFRLTVDPRGGRVRGRTSPQAQRARQFGDALFGALLADGSVRDVYTAAAHDAEAAGRGLRLTLYVTAAPDLAGIPWEFLYRRPAFLAQSIWTPVVRYLDLDSPPPALSVQPPLKLLGMVSQPTGDGWPALDVEVEQAKLEQALAPLVDEGYVQLRWLAGSTLRDLQREVATGDDFHVFHFIGHGEFDDRTGVGSLVLEGVDSSARYVDGETLGTVLCDRRSLRLAVLNSCEGAKASPVDPLAGVAAGLVQHDVPAVVGMQFAISDQAAITFASELYSGLAHAFPIDVAVTEGRRALATEGDDLEWATPVLFMRVPDGGLFDIDLSAHTPVAPSSDGPDDVGSGPDESPRHSPPQLRRRVLLGGLAALCAIAVAVAVLLQGPPPIKQPFRAELAAAMRPLVTANRNLTSAVVSLDADSSPGQALERYYSAADVTTAFGGAVAGLRPSAVDDRRLHREAGRLGDYEATYLRYVIAFLTGTSTPRNEEQFGSVSARLVRSLRRLSSVVPGAHDSVKGAAHLKRWARTATPGQRDAAPPVTTGDSPPDASATATAGDRRAAPARDAHFAGDESRTAAPGTPVPVGVTAKDAQGRDLTVRCDRRTVSVTGDPVRVTCTAFLPGGATRSTSFSVAPRRPADAATATPREPDGADTPPEPIARPPRPRVAQRRAAPDAAARTAPSTLGAD